MADHNKVHAHSAQLRRAGRRRLRLSLFGSFLAGAAVFTSSSGCATLNGVSQSLQNCDCVDDFMIGYRNRALAAQAWYEVEVCYENRAHLDHFQAGFLAGYGDIAGGGTGCTPSIAPREYWGWQYQSPEGQAKVAAWFAGYPMGAKAAEEDGLANWSQIPTMLHSPSPPPSPDTAPPPQPAVRPEGVPVRIPADTQELVPAPADPLNMPSGFLDSTIERIEGDGLNDVPLLEENAGVPEGTSASILRQRSGHAR